jgi:nicotinamidase/pyrazinamidase
MPAAYDRDTALIVTDLQNDFGDPRGGLYVQGGEEVVPVVNAEIEAAAASGALIVYSQDWHPSVTPHFQKDGGIWPVHCVGDTWGAELMPGLHVRGDAEFLRKGTGGEDGYSVFTVRDPESGERAPTKLEQLLRDRAVRRVVVVGLATDYCVKETALDALRLGFDTEVLPDGCRAVDLEPGDGDRAVREIRAAGGTIS